MKLRLIFQILISLLIIIGTISIVTNETNKLPVQIGDNGLPALIKEKTYILFVTTKDGYLHALEKGGKEIWKVHLERELISSNISTRKIRDNLFLMPFNEGLYIYKEGKFISLDIFIRDLVRRQYTNINDLLLLGKTKTTVFIIDVETGTIIKKSDDDDNLITKKRYVTQMAKKRMITVLRIDYILSCLGTEDDQKFWNASYSDVIIQRGNEEVHDEKLNNPLRTIKDLLVNNNGEINLDDIVTVHCYFHGDFPPIKIFDRSNKVFDLNKKKEINGEIKYLTDNNNIIINKNYNNGNKNYDEDVENKLQAFKEMNKYIEWKFQKDKEKITAFSIKIKDYIKTNIILIAIIIILSAQLIYYKIICYFNNNKILIKNNKNDENKNINNKYSEIYQQFHDKKKINDNINKKDLNNQRKRRGTEINNKNKYNDENNNNFSLTEKLKTKKYKHKPKSSLYSNKCDNLTEKTGEDNNDNNNNNTNSNSGSNYGEDDSKKYKIDNSQNNEENKSNTIKMEQQNNSIRSKKSEKEKEADSSFHGIWNDDEDEDENGEYSEENNEKIEEKDKDNENKKTEEKDEESKSKGNGIWDNNEDDEEEDESKDKKGKKEENKETKESGKTTKTSNKKQNDESKGNGIWDNDEDDDEEEDEEEDKGKKKEDNKEEEKEQTTKTETSNKKENDESESKGNGIWDNNDDNEEEEEVEEKDNNKNSENTRTNKLNNKDSYDSPKNTITNKSNISKQRKKSKSKNQKLKEDKKLTRLDEDFENIEKIGQGGFGIVLKARHKIDKGTYAIKVIKLSDMTNKDDVINEAKTMLNIYNKHIVQYKICWFQKTLGSAAKYMIPDDSSSSITSESNKILSKSLTVSINKKTKSKMTNNYGYNNSVIKEEKEESEDNNDSNKPSKTLRVKGENKSKEVKKKFYAEEDENNSYKANKNKKIFGGESKYCVEFNDDSRIVSKSIISSKYDIESESENLNEYFFILMEYCDDLTLEKYIAEHHGGCIDRKIIYTFTYQIIKSLKKIHSIGIIHRDIKPANIFIKNNEIKLGDFGLATKNINNSKYLQTKDLIGWTPLYSAPEQKTSKVYNEKIDIYAVGITLYEMCSCFDTFMEKSESIKILSNKNIINDRIKKSYPEETKLIELMTKRNYDERPSAAEILSSDLFKNLGVIVNFSKD